MIKRGLVCFGFILMFLGLASARITINEPNSIYNLGDRLYVNLTVAPNIVSGNFEINILCKNSSINIYRVPAEPSFVIGVEQKISTFITLSKELMKNNLGDCYISVLLGAEQAVSRVMQITDKVNVKVSLNKRNYNPGERVSFLLNATKANSQQLEGFLEVSDAQSFSRAVQKGIVNDSFVLEEKAEAGNYMLTFSVYDRGINNSILNNGVANFSFVIDSVSTSLLTSISDNDANPGENFSFSIDLFDQTGKIMNNKISVKLVSPLNKEISFNVNSGDINNFNFETNATAGKWRIDSFVDNISDTKEFNMKESAKIDFDFVDSVLLVKNIGNVVYNSSFEVMIGNEARNVSVDLGIGEEKKFYLKAPDGEYSVKVGDKEKTLLLTGNAIAVRDSDSGSYIIVYFIVGLIAAFILIVGLRVSKKKVYAEEPISGPRIMPKFQQKNEQKTMQSKAFGEVKQKSLSISIPTEQKKDSFLDVRKSSVSEAERSAVLKGHKTNSVVICMKFFNNFGGNAKHEIERALMIAREKRAVVEWTGNEILIIFSPLITKMLDNEHIAARAGFDMFNYLNNYNSRFSDKVEFGIGMSSGDLIAVVEGGKLKYTSIGNTILLAKKIADIAKGRILVSDVMRNKIARDIRGEKVSEIGSSAVWSITSLQDREANKAKLDDLLKRIGQH